MLFNLFGKKKGKISKSILKDRIFISTEAKMNACIQLAQEKSSIIFIAWFIDTAKLYKELFEKNRINPLKIILAREVHASTVNNHTPVFLEHHPLQQKESDLINNWQHDQIIVLSSLDEALFKRFGSDKIISVVKMMGMKENEPIEHAMITKSINKAQQKIEETVTIEQPANSQSEWMEKNLK